MSVKYIKFFRHFNSLALISATGFYFYRETLGLESRKKTLELTINDKPVSVPKKLNRLINEVMDDMKLSTEGRSLIKPVLTGCLDMKHLGFAGGKCGAVLGIPHYFLLDNPADFNFNLVINDVEFTENKSPLEILKSTICFSDAAKKFAIAHEIYEAGHSSFYTVGILPVILLLIINTLRHKVEKSPSAKLKKYFAFFHFQVILTCVLFFIIFYDLNSGLRECEADLKAANLGKSYIEGGVEYYEKIIERNKTLKSVLKKAPYDKDGDINVDYFRTCHMSLLKRVNYLKELLQSGDKQGKKFSAWEHISIWEIIQK